MSKDRAIQLPSQIGLANVAVQHRCRGIGKVTHGLFLPH